MISLNFSCLLLATRWQPPSIMAILKEHGFTRLVNVYNGFDKIKDTNAPVESLAESCS